MRSRLPLIFPAAIIAGLLASCTAGAVPSETAPGGSSPGTAVVDAVSCADVTIAVAAYIEGLEPRADNESDEYGALCGWEAPEGATDLADVRSVEVLISFEASDGLTAEQLTAAGLTPLADAAIESAGGIAYTAEAGTSAAAVIVTTVAMPEVEVVVTGGQWDGYPALDGPAAVEVARTILGLP